MENSRPIPARLKEARRAAGLTFGELSARTGYAKSVLQRYEAGTVSKIPADRLEKIARALCVTPAWLLGEDEPTALSLLSEAFRSHGILKKGEDLTQEQLDDYLSRLKSLLDAD